MKGFNTNIEKETLENTNFRKVLYTGKHSQLVLMSLKPLEEIGIEVHTDNDQFFRFEKGEGKVFIDGNEYTVGDGSAIIVPSGAEHNVVNVSETEDLKLYTILRPIIKMVWCEQQKQKPKRMVQNLMVKLQSRI